MTTSHILDDILVHHHLVCRAQERIKSNIDLSLAGSGGLVVVLFYLNADLFHFQNHFTADILLGIGWRDGEIPLLMPKLSPRLIPSCPMFQAPSSEST